MRFVNTYGQAQQQNSYHFYIQLKTVFLNNLNFIPLKIKKNVYHVR